MRKILTFTGVALSSLHGALQDQNTSILDANMSALAERDASYAVILSAPLNVSMENMYAGHRSHSSHSSHRSHSSHYSGSGSSYTPPAPPPSPRPSYKPPSTYRPPESTTYRPAATPATTTYQPATPKASSGTGTSWRGQLLQPSSAPRPSADQLQLMIMRVQAALYSKGYDPGAIDGVLGETTKAALRSFQASHGLAASGAMTTETLNALGISLRP